MNSPRGAELIFSAETKVYIHHRENSKSGIYHYYFRRLGNLWRGSTKTKDRAQATNAAVAAYFAARAGETPAKRKASFKETAERWLALNEHHRDIANRRQATTKMIEFFDAVAKVRDVGQLSQKDINDYLAWRKTYHTATERKGKREYLRGGKRVVGKAQSYGVASNDTLNRENQSLRMILAFAADEGWPTGTLKVPTLPSERRRRPHFSAEEEAVLWRLAKLRIDEAPNGKTRQERAMLLEYMAVLRATGMRPCELGSVRWADIDLGGGTLAIRKRHKTAPRTIPLDLGEADRIVSELKAARVAEAEAAGRTLKITERVFPGRGEASRSFKRSLERLVEECGFAPVAGKKRTAYSLRHSFATELTDEGMSSSMLARVMGTSTKMIEMNYDHGDTIQSVRNWLAAKTTA
ncbi:MAG: site-specific integrase [Devosia sp.]|nr:site-specific integrase [Devosia sp.]